MIDFSPPLIDVLHNHISVRKAAEHSGYSDQYLRRMLRSGRIDGQKVGVVWLIRIGSLESYLSSRNGGQDRRFGPRCAQQPGLHD